MTGPAVKAWRCEICGYIHEGPEPPDACPLCGAAASDFSPCAETVVLSTPTAAVDAAHRIVVAGGGVAGVSAAESARQASPDAEITLVSAELGIPYYRLNLTRLLAGEIGEDSLPLHPATWYEQQRIHLLSGVAVTAITPDRHEIKLSDGRSLPFDKLILAAGARAFVPPWSGADLANVFSIRTLDDVRCVIAALKPGTHCLCIGGGILGLETAGALAGRGVQVDLLEGSGWLMPRQLTRTAGEILAEHVAELGIRLQRNARTKEIIGTDCVTGVALENGTVLSADLVIVTTGIRSQNNLASAAGLTVKQGVVVDDFLVTSHPEILAAGDVAEHRGIVSGLWPAAQYQGALAGRNAVGQRSAFGGIPRSNVLKVLGLHVFSIGRFESEPGDVVVEETVGRRYERYLFRDGRLAGANLIDRSGIDSALKKAIENSRDFSSILAQKPSASDIAESLQND